MSHGALVFVAWAMTHGMRCWSEVHLYGGPLVGTWREWLCK